jgi:hypothetical protein
MGFHYQSLEKGCARTIAFKLGWSSPPDERLGFGGGSANSPFEVDWQGFEVGFMMENVIFYIKKKRMQIRGRTRFEEDRNYSAATALESLLIFLNVCRKILQVHIITIVAFILWYSWYHISIENGGSSSS